MTRPLLAAASLFLATLFLGAPVSAAPGQLGAEDSLHPDAIKARIAPVGGVCLRGEACQPAGIAAAPAPAATDATASADGAAAAGRSGEEVYKSVCGMCHASGLAGAPKTGDKAGWAPRIAQGEDVLVKHAIEGIRGMPARGTCANCTDDEIKATVQFMVSQSK